MRGTICHAALLPRCFFEKFTESEGVIVKMTFISKLNKIINYCRIFYETALQSDAVCLEIKDEPLPITPIVTSSIEH